MFKRDQVISIPSSKLLMIVDEFAYIRSNISSTESNINIRLTKLWNAIEKLLIIQKSDLSNKIKQDFFQAVSVTILLYGCTTWMLTKHIEKKLDGIYPKMLCAVLHKSWKQYFTKQLLLGHLPLISQTMQGRQTKHEGHCWRSKDELISDVFKEQGSVSQSAKTYLCQICADTGCFLKDLLGRWMIGMDGKGESKRTWWRYIYLSGGVHKVLSPTKNHEICMLLCVYIYVCV